MEPTTAETNSAAAVVVQQEDTDNALPTAPTPDIELRDVSVPTKGGDTSPTATSTTSDGKKSSNHGKSCFRSVYIFITALLAAYWKYFKYNMNEIRKRFCSYLIGVFSCFLVVVMALVSASALQQLPIIFLRLGTYFIQIILILQVKMPMVNLI